MAQPRPKLLNSQKVEDKALKQMNSLTRSIAAVVVGSGLFLTSPSASHSAGSFSDLNIEYGELKLAFEAALADSRQLRDTIAENAKALADARESLVQASSEAAIFRAQTQQMKFRIEALGIGAFAGGDAKLEQRLLAAVNQLRTAAIEKTKISEALVRLTEAASLFAKSELGQNADSRLALEAEIRNSHSALLTESISSHAQAQVPAIENGSVISIKDDLSLVVVNVGLSSGVKLGMPLEVVRNEQTIGHIRVVDVRERISGGLIQYLVSNKETFRTGDRVKVAAQQ